VVEEGIAHDSYFRKFRRSGQRDVTSMQHPREQISREGCGV
jgi:hypothetical protein